MTKLNTFHWHITDSQSFPLILKSHPDLSRLGAYNSEKVYTAENIADVSPKPEFVNRKQKTENRLTFCILFLDLQLCFGARCHCIA